MEFFKGQRLPYEIDVLEIRIAVVHDVVSDIPKTVWRQRGKKYQPSQPRVEAAVRREALMTGIVAQNKKAADEKSGGDASHDFKNRIGQHCRSAEKDKKQADVGQGQQQCMG